MRDKSKYILCGIGLIICYTILIFTPPIPPTHCISYTFDDNSNMILCHDYNITGFEIIFSFIIIFGVIIMFIIMFYKDNKKKNESKVSIND